MRRILLASVVIALSCGAAAPSCNIVATQAPQYFFMNASGGINFCERAGTVDEHAQCEGIASQYHVADFNCDEPEVDAEFIYCGKPFPE